MHLLPIEKVHAQLNTRNVITGSTPVRPPEVIFQNGLVFKIAHVTYEGCNRRILKRYQLPTEMCVSTHDAAKHN